MRHVRTFPPHRSALPLASPLASRWEQLPSAQRQRLLWLLSQLLRRQLEQAAGQREEDSYDADPRPH